MRLFKMTPVTIAFVLCWAILPLLAAQRRSSAPSVDARSSRPHESPQRRETSLLEVGEEQRLRKGQVAVEQIRVISYNIRWRSGKDLKKLVELFRNDPEIGNAGIMGLQEVDRNKRRSGNTNTAKLMADELGLHYAWAAPPVVKDEDEEETGVAIFSLFPMSDLQRIVLPHEGPGHRRRVALGATVKIGDLSVRVYSIHAETRIPLDKKVEQMSAVLQDLAHYPKSMPVIVLGDLNTWEANAKPRTNKLFSDAGFHTPFGSQTTFSRQILFVPLELKLDWVWLRGLEFSSYGIDRKVELSDHWPLWVNLRMPTRQQQTVR